MDDALRFQEISHLTDRKVEIREARTAYLAEHPELRPLLNDLTAAVLLEKPDNIFAFAARHFAAFATPPMLAPTVVVLVAPIDLVGIVEALFPETFAAPRGATTRVPRAGENLDRVDRNSMRDPDKFFEVGDDDDVPGELVGTSLEAVARVAAAGRIPLLQCSRRRAVVARKCQHVRTSRTLLFTTTMPPDDYDCFDKVHRLPATTPFADVIRDHLRADLPALLHPRLKSSSSPLVVVGEAPA
ncbi:hypothetical protein CTAYLR_000476 [Chrysophaeum taylorii]|uniref:RIIa domain-containing protein n=1 Tax=Chrysophaeum taylorii TaxID=2483200 RepID=A0AAD7UG42_9STRA|nr:hypothetical protein CTAYLR_000476 [Chrysophaeum taylorii]